MRVTILGALAAWAMSWDPAAAAAQSAATADALKIVWSPHEFVPRTGDPVAAELGAFLVPERRADPDSRQIELKFVRFKSTAAQPGYPIVYLAGGPGGSGIGAASGGRFPLFMALRAHADVIALDQRGTGLSNSMPFCEPADDAPPLTATLTRETLLASLEATARVCSQFWRENGVDLEGYTTWESAEDLESLRLALGVEKINLWGISYGTHLAFAALRQHGENVYRAVLASSEGPDETVKLPSRTDAYLEQIAEMAAAQPDLAEVVPDLVGLMRSELDRLEKEPALVTVRGSNGKPAEMTIGKAEVQMMTGFLIKNPSTLRLLPMLFVNMSRGNFGFIAPQLAQFRTQNGMAGMPELMDATSGISTTRAARVELERVDAVLGDMLNFPGPALAPALGVATLPDSFRSPLSSDVPTLFLSGSLDGRTYVASHREVAQGFSEASFVLIEGAGHDLFMSSPEVERRILDFLERGTTSTESIVLEPLEFVVPPN